LRFKSTLMKEAKMFNVVLRPSLPGGVGVR